MQRLWDEWQQYEGTTAAGHAERMAGEPSVRPDCEKDAVVGDVAACENRAEEAPGETMADEVQQARQKGKERAQQRREAGAASARPEEAGGRTS
eukprot:11150727-Lingulodinium_polyedra.AAC.1